jgi:D-glycero-beta-D-manno-heptose 1-phosphate adenylyltransferase
VRYLRAARSLGEILVVAVNDDRSARRLRGPGRPIMGDADRARVVAALEGVDFVVLFGDRTVAPLVRRLRPDIQCKGTDYTPSTVPEGKTVRSHGGIVRIVGDRKRHASTDLIRRIALRLRRRAQRSHRPVT